MPDITNPTVTAYSNESIRPIADRIVLLKALIDTEIARYYAEILPILVADSNTSGDEIIDGAQSDGRAVVEYDDLMNFITQITAIQTLLDGAGVMDVLSKPRVRGIL